jgi:hypothetical protein
MVLRTPPPGPRQCLKVRGAIPPALAEGRIRFAGQQLGGWVKQVDAWKALGARYLIASRAAAG